MNVPKSMIAVALMALQSAALAQATAPDPNCPLKGLVEKSTLAGGRVAIRSVEKAGPQDCRGPGNCTNDVKVQSFTRSDGAKACCTLIEWGTMRVIKGNHLAFLRWDLKPQDGKRYVFNPGGVFINPPPAPTPDDLGPLTLSAGDTKATIKSVNKNAVTFNYGVSVSLKQANGSYLACDLNDPVIVNQGD